MLNKSQVLTTTQVRQKLNKILKDVASGDTPYYIFDRSTPKAVLLDIDVYNDLMDNLEELQDAYELLKSEAEETTSFSDYDNKRTS